MGSSAIDDRRLHCVLEGVAAGIIGLIVATMIDLGLAVARSAPSLPPAAAIFAAALALLYSWRSRVCVPAVILGSAASGLIAFD